MRWAWLLAAAAFAAAASGALAEAEIKRWSGGPTPQLAATDLTGRSIDLKALRGRVVVLNFWATWCDPCKEEMPTLQRLRDRLSGRPLEVLTVNYGEFRDKIATYVERQGITLPVLLDTQKDAAKGWGVGGLPMTFVIDARGRIRYSVYGELDWSDEKAARLVENLIGEAPGAGH
jgi:thiol-disulfide isomerase/thioredoxin